MKKKAVRILIVIIVILAFIGAIITHHFRNRTHYTNSYDGGNTSGNLYNGGKFCEYEGLVYFSNTNDNNALYVMDTNQANQKKLVSDEASFLNADDYYIYYTRSNGSTDTSFSFLNISKYSLCRINKNGKSRPLVLDQDPCMNTILVKDYLYYLHYDTSTATTLYRVNIDGSNRELVSNQPFIPGGKNEHMLYYTGTVSDHYIHYLDTDTNATGIFLAQNCYHPIIVNNTIYSMDIDNNYRISRIDLTTGSKEFLTDSRVDCYNISGDYLYYQRSSPTNPAFCRVKLDGSSQPEEIRSGNYTNICVTSDFVYFASFESQSTIYQIPTSNSTVVTLFNPSVQ